MKRTSELSWACRRAASPLKEPWAKRHDVYKHSNHSVMLGRGCNVTNINSFAIFSRFLPFHGEDRWCSLWSPGKFPAS